MCIKFMWEKTVIVCACVASMCVCVAKSLVTELCGQAVCGTLCCARWNKCVSVCVLYLVCY